MVGRLSGKVAVVTGGASGVGLATVRRFVDEGASVVFCDLAAGAGDALRERLGATKARLHYLRREAGGPNDGHAIAEELGDRAVFVPADVTVTSDLEAVIGTAVDRFGGLDIMFNNAGTGAAEGSVVDCSEEVFDRLLEVNLKAVWMGIKLSAPHLAARGGGSIISTASMAAVTGIPGLAAYGSSKAGVCALTRAAAVELAHQLIRVNALLPGAVVTPLVTRGADPAEVEERMAHLQPIPRAGRPSDIADAALFLASDESSFVTGHALVVDGGATIESDSRMRPR